MKRKKSHKALRKDFFVEIRKTYNKFLSLLFIVALGVAFYSGVRSTEPDMKQSADKLYDDSNFMDIKLLAPAGLTQAELDAVGKLEQVEQVAGSYSADALDVSLEDSGVVRLMSQNSEMNRVTIKKGRPAETPEECIVHVQYMKKQGYKLGDMIRLTSGRERDISYYLKRTEYKIVGTFTSPFYIQSDKGSSDIGNGKVSGVIYIQSENFVSPVYTEAYITVTGAREQECYSAGYEDMISEASERIQKENESFYVLDRNKLQQYVEFEMDADRVGKIGETVPIIFFIVAALVSLTTMIRMVEEQRTQIGTLKALGYGNVLISMKYIMYGFLATVSGSLLGGIIGGKVLPFIIINAYRIVYQNLTVIVTPLNMRHFLAAVVLAMACVIGATMAACFKTLLESSAELMRPAAPKQGKRVFLEYVPLIWKHLGFIWKSAIRNLIRYKKKIIMTIFGICGCMSLLLIGFGIKNSISSIVAVQYGSLHTYNAELSFENGLSPTEKEQVRNHLVSNEKVDSAINIYQGGAVFEFDGDELNGYIYVPDDPSELKDYIVLRDSVTKEPVELNDDEIVITKKMAKLLGISKGDTLTVKMGEKISGTAVVGAVTENYVYHYVFMTKNVFARMFGISAESNQMLVNLMEEYKDEDVSAEFLAIEGISSTNSIDTLRNTFSEMLKGLDIIIVVIVAAAGGLAFVVLYNLNTINIGERIRELATLKVLGFYDGEVSSYVFRENVILTVIGILCGYIGGNFLHKFVIDTIEVDMVMFGREIYGSSYLYATLITLLFAVIINCSMHFKLKKIDMTTSLKSVE